MSKQTFMGLFVTLLALERVVKLFQVRTGNDETVGDYISKTFIIHPGGDC